MLGSYLERSPLIIQRLAAIHITKAKEELMSLALFCPVQTCLALFGLICLHCALFGSILPNWPCLAL